jgi:hypothetical protein
MQKTVLYIPLWVKNRPSTHILFPDRIFLILIIQVSFIFSSCEKKPEPLYTNSVITGYSNVYESIGEDMDITVVAYGPYGQSAIHTGEGGNYAITGLGNGTYMLDFIKEGYGTIRKYGIQLFGNDTVYAGQVLLFKKYDSYKLPVFRGVTIETRGNLYIVVEPDKLGFEAVTPLVFFMDVEKSVDYKNYTYSTGNFIKWRPDQISDYFNLYIAADYLPFKSGTEVFIIGYVCNPNEINNGYFDKYLGIEELSTLIPEKHSQVMSFIMP